MFQPSFLWKQFSSAWIVWKPFITIWFCVDIYAQPPITNLPSLLKLTYYNYYGCAVMPLDAIAPAVHRTHRYIVSSYTRYYIWNPAQNISCPNQKCTFRSRCCSSVLFTYVSDFSTYVSDFSIYVFSEIKRCMCLARSVFAPYYSMFRVYFVAVRLYFVAVCVFFGNRKKLGHLLLSNVRPNNGKCILYSNYIISMYILFPSLAAKRSSGLYGCVVPGQ